MRTHALAIVLFAALTGCSSVGEVRTLGRYDFSYRIEGDARAAPLQIFDDGRQTYFQFRESVPAIFAVGRDPPLVILPSRREGPYVVVDCIEREFVFLLGADKTRATGKYIGNQNRAVLPQELAALRDPEPTPEAATPLAPVSYKVPFALGKARFGASGERSLQALLPQALVAMRVEILTQATHRRGERGFGLKRARAVRDWLAGHGVSRTGLVIVKTATSSLAPNSCEIRLTPADSPGKSDLAAAHNTEPPRPTLYGAAQPNKVSLPAQPVFVERGGAGTTNTGVIGQ